MYVFLTLSVGHCFVYSSNRIETILGPEASLNLNVIVWMKYCNYCLIANVCFEKRETLNASACLSLTVEDICKELHLGCLMTFEPIGVTKTNGKP